MRLFIGLALNDQAREALERVNLRLRTAKDGLRWSTPEQWHITLAFLGSVEIERETVLLRELRRIRHDAVPLEIDGLGFFERVGILHAAVEVTPGLAELQRQVVAAVRASALPVEDRPYRPHVTLARTRGRSGQRTIKQLASAATPQRPHVSWTASEFLLYESQLSPAGARYLVRARFALGEPAAA